MTFYDVARGIHERPCAVGGAGGGADGQGIGEEGAEGRAVQVDPIKPKLKAPGT